MAHAGASCLFFDVNCGHVDFNEVDNPFMSYISGGKQMTMSIWLYGSFGWAKDMNDPQREYTFAGYEERYGGALKLLFSCPWMVEKKPGFENMIYTIDLDSINYFFDDANEYTGQWNHYAFVKDGNSMSVYRNGWPRASLTNANRVIPDVKSFKLGVDSLDGEFVGWMDEFKVFDYALTNGQILTLAGVGQIDIPLDSTGDVSGDQKVNFVDYCYVAKRWLDGPVLWP